MSMLPTTGPIRPPSEAHSLLLRVTKNCPWNRCEFCITYKGERFQLRQVAEVKADILAAQRLVADIQRRAEQTGSQMGDIARYHGILWLQDDGVKSVFLQDSDSLILKTEQLVGIVRFLRSVFPTLDRVTSEFIISDHVNNFFMGEIDGKLPQDKTKLLGSVDRALAKWREKDEPKRHPFLGGLDQSDI